MKKRKIVICEFAGFGERAALRAFKSMGYEVIEYYCQSNDFDTDKQLLSELSALIDHEKPEFVFSFDFLPIVSKVCNVFQILYVCWVYDSPEIHLYSKAISNAVNRIFIFDKLQYKRFYSRSPQTVFYLPLATNPMTEVQIQEITSREHDRYNKDISFVGSLYNEHDKRFQDLLGLPEYWRGFIDGIVNAQLQVFGYNFIMDSISEQETSELKRLLNYTVIADYDAVDCEIIADHFIGRYCSALDRTRTIQYVSQRHPLTIYTYSDTCDIERAVKGGKGSIENQGIADPVMTTPKIFHCSRINLNITSKTIYSGIPLRVFDILGSGGFCISNYQAELYELFSPGEDLVVYEDLNDLDDKITYYLHHEDERIAIAEHGYRTVCENYTYEIMLKTMMETVYSS